MLDRRRFLVGAAGAVASAVRADAAWSSQQSLRAPLQSTGEAAGFGAVPARWAADRALLHVLPRWLELAAVPGVALAVVDGGRVWSQGFGRASVEQRTEVGDATVFEAASLGKPVFAYAVLRLVDAGVLTLDRPLYDYLPVPEAADARMRRVTARHVLSHTTGLPNWRSQDGPLAPTAEPGATFGYSGEAFFFLQRVVERLTGTPIARLVREQVLAPLDMSESSYVWRPAYEARMATGYDEHGQGLEVYAAIGRKAETLATQWQRPLEEWRYDDAARAVPLIQPAWPALPVFMMPNVAASLFTTVGDYARFVARLVAAAPASGLALKPETRSEMLRPHVKLNSALSWGLGWGIERDEQGTYLWHWGANMSFRNFALADPANGRAVVVLTNSLNGPKLYQRVVNAVTGHDHAAFLWPYL
jgi:CubicO group peptidase (beta-lactamase class C family)